jgi:hypothetical protein
VIVVGAVLSSHENTASSRLPATMPDGAGMETAPTKEGGATSAPPCDVETTATGVEADAR